MNNQVYARFMIDTGVFIDFTDKNWSFYVIFLKETDFRTFAGFVNFYPFNLSAVQSRMRISQLLILPVFQRRGLATSLLKVIFC